MPFGAVFADVPKTPPTITHIHTIDKNDDNVYQCAGDVGEFGELNLEILNKITKQYDRIDPGLVFTDNRQNCIKQRSLNTEVTLSVNDHNGTLARCKMVYNDVTNGRSTELLSSSLELCVIQGNVIK